MSYCDIELCGPCGCVKCRRKTSLSLEAWDLQVEEFKET